MPGLTETVLANIQVRFVPAGMRKYGRREQ